MTQHSIDFLLIMPELFQVILINTFLLFAICFSYYNIKTSPGNIYEIALLAVWKGAQEKISNNKNPVSTELISFEKQPGFLDLKLPFNKNSEAFNNYIPINLNKTSSWGLGAGRYLSYPYWAYLITPALHIEVITYLTILSFLCCCILYINNPLTYAIGLTDSIIWDNVGRLTSVLLCLSVAVTLGLGISTIKRFSRYEFVFIIWLSILGMLCLMKSYNFLAFYLSVELQSLSFYMLAAMRSKTEASAEAGLKYFILSAFSSAILLLGVALIYGAIGSQNFADLSISLAYFTGISKDNLDLLQISAHAYYPWAGLWVGLGCVCISLLFKLAAAPFHAWVADVYEGSPTPITAFFAITSKIAVLTALIWILELSDHSLIVPLTFVASISLVIGTLSAMWQVKLKRLLAFSGVANVGWFLLALIAGQWDLLILHLVVYILLSISLFSIFILPLFRTHPNLEYRERLNLKHGLMDHGADSLTIKYINDLHLIYKTNPCLAFAVTIAMFSLAGIPPLAGFYSKYLILNAITQSEQYLVLIIALGAAVISAFYYIRIIKTIYFSSGLNKSRLFWTKTKMFAFKEHFLQDNSWFTISTIEIGPNAYICAISTFLTILFFVKPDYVCIWMALSQ